MDKIFCPRIKMNSVLPGSKLDKQPIKVGIKPLVSVITPFYNAKEYFEQTYNSVINQTFPWFEWIIVDDGSNEENREFIEGYKDLDSRIRIIHQENGGLACARNTGVSNTSTDYFLPLDADDLISDNCLEILYWALTTNASAAWAYCDVAGFQDMEYIWKKNFSAITMKSENLLVATALIRKKDYEEIGGYKVEKCSYNEDWRFWLEMLSAHKQPVHVNEVLFWYRRHDSMLVDVRKDKEKIEFNKRIIDNAKVNVDTSIEAIEFPIKENPKEFSNLEYRKWDNQRENDNSISILWILPWMNVGGADKFNYQAMSGIKKYGCKNYVATTVSSPNNWENRFKECTEEIHHLPNFISRYKYPEYISYLIQTRGIACVIVTNAEDGYWMIPWLRQHHPDVAIIDYVHMEEWYWHGGGHARSSSMARGLLDKTFVCNSATKRVMIEKLKAASDKVECLHIGVDADYYDANKVDSYYLHNLLKLEKDKKIVLFPCRVCEQKRPFMMLEIARRINKIDRDIVFVVVGEGPDLEALKKKINAMQLQNCVYCIGNSENMRECYKDSELLLICSLQEGLTLTTYEALSMGVPVISSDVGGQSDLVSDAVGGLIPFEGNNASTASRNNYTDNEVERFVERILLILHDTSLAKQLGEQARTNIVAKYSVNIMAQKLYKEIVAIVNDKTRIQNDRILSSGLAIATNLGDEFYTSHIRWHLEETYTNNVGLIRRIYYRAVKWPVIGENIHSIGKFLKKVLRK